MKNVQIPADLFFKLCRYFAIEDFPDGDLDGENDDMFYDSERDELNMEITNGLKLKLDALAKHAMYSRYKDKSLSDEERQAARRAYLDSVGMRDGYRWKTLEPPI